MASSCSVKCILVTTILCYISGVRTEVPEYCLQPLNTSDCGGSPVTVMTYWKPGSRCELDVWKGCPTVNKFPDEYNCSATCIFRPNISEIYLDDEPAMNEWEGKLEKMEMTELKQMVDILDNVVTDTDMNEITEKTSVPLKDINEIKIETTTTEEPVVEIADTDQEQESTEQDTTEDITTEHITTEHITTEHTTTEHTTTEHQTAEDPTTEHITTEHTTTEHITTEHTTTEHITTEHTTTEHTTTEHTTTEHSATEQAAVETNATTVKEESSSEGDSDEIDVVTTY